MCRGAGGFLLSTRSGRLHGAILLQVRSRFGKLLMAVSRVYLLLIVIFNLVAGCVAQSGDPQHPQLEKVDMPGIYNFTLLSASSGIGGELAGFGGTTAPSAMPELKAAGFGTVINMRQATEPGAEVEASRMAAEAAGLGYVHLPFNPLVSKEGIVDEFLAVVSDTENHPIYIHCSSATRVAALWMTMRVEGDNWSVVAASEEAMFIAGRPDRAVELGTSLIASRSQ
jgi:uncharacterized protein (TIGR01244 family)